MWEGRHGAEWHANGLGTRGRNLGQGGISIRVYKKI